MNHKYAIKVFSQEDLIKADCMNMQKVIQVCENALTEYIRGNMIFPDKISVVFEESSQKRINCLPAAILDQNVYGMKWVSVFPPNPRDFNKPNLSAVILLSELTTGYPVALMEGSMITNLRTAAVGAIAAKYLARPESEIMGLIGPGEIGKSHILSMKSVLPNLKKCMIASVSYENEMEAIHQLEKICPDLEYVPCHADCREAVVNADVIVTAISSQEKILQAEWIKEGAFYCHAAGLEDDFAVPKKASKIVCDDWHVVKHRTQTISQMYKLGLLHDEDIYANLYELINGNKPGRENNSEFIYFNSVGLSYIDVMVASWMYHQASEAGLGTSIEIKNKSMFD